MKETWEEDVLHVMPSVEAAKSRVMAQNRRGPHVRRGRERSIGRNFESQQRPPKMSKRSATELLQTSTIDGKAFAKASGSGAKREAVPNDEMGEFEDAWEDDIESDEDVVDAEAGEGEDGAFLI